MARHKSVPIATVACRYRNQSVASESPSSYRIVDEFTTGQISAGHTSYILRKIDSDHIEMVMEGGAVKLQRCK